MCNRVCTVGNHCSPKRNTRVCVCLCVCVCVCDNMSITAGDERSLHTLDQRPNEEYIKLVCVCNIKVRAHTHTYTHVRAHTNVCVHTRPLRFLFLIFPLFGWASTALLWISIAGRTSTPHHTDSHTSFGSYKNTALTLIHHGKPSPNPNTNLNHNQFMPNLKPNLNSHPISNLKAWMNPPHMSTDKC